MPGKRHDPEIKAAVMTALLTGQSVSEVAQQYSLDKSVVSRWKKVAKLQLTTKVATEKSDHDTPDTESFGDKLQRLFGEYVIESLTTLRVQAEHMRDKRWLSKQSASELGVSHGVLHDKTLRSASMYVEDAGEADSVS